MAIAFVSATSSSSNSFSVDVTSGTNLLVVAVMANSGGTYSGTFNGDALSVSTQGDGYVKLLYRLNPDIGNFTLALTGTSLQQAVALQYSGADGYLSVNPSSGAGGVANNDETTSTDGELLIAVLNATSTSGTANTGTTERYDSGGGHAQWVGDRICGTAGTFNCGVSTASEASIIIAHFSASDEELVDVSGSASFPLMVADGIVYEPNVSGAVTFPALAAAGVVYEPNVSGDVSFPALQASGTVDETDARGAVTFPALVADGIVYQPDIDGAVSFPALVASGSIDETTAQGAATFPALVAAGVVYQPDIDGAVSFPSLVTAGLIDELIVASGAATFPALLAAGIVYEPNVSGAVSFPLLVALGAIEGEDDVATPPGQVTATATPSSAYGRAYARGAQATATVSRAKGRLV